MTGSERGRGNGDSNRRPPADASPRDQTALADTRLSEPPAGESGSGPARLGATAPYHSGEAAAADRLAEALGTPSDRQPRTDIGRGTVVHRYVIHDRIGEGGMGVVYAAYDPELDRKIALKFLHSGGADRMRRQRLLREAQAMARLSHPAVAAVHDVGTYRGQVFLAMEFVDGTTLTRWLEAQPRDWREVRRVFVEAGRGLAAAHGAGIVHRDFKPDNVLVDRDGHAKVTDFGLARGLGDSDSEPGDRAAVEDPAGSSGDRRALDTPLTRTGALMGTPCYMSPEQHRGEPADDKSDQYSFAVALHQALYGELPYRGDSHVELREAVLAGALHEPPAGAAVPGWLRKVVVRGLATARDRRYPSMDALLAELDPRPRSHRWLPLAVAATVAAGALGYALLVRHREPMCTGGEAKLKGIWDQERRTAVHQALAGGGRSYGEAVWLRVEADLDRYAGAWVADWREACAATNQRHEQSDHLLDLRMRCLDRRLGELAATVAFLSGSVGPEGVDQAVQLVQALPPARDCDDLESLELETPLPGDPATRAVIEASEKRLAEGWVLLRTGEYQRALEVARGLLPDLATVDYPPVRARSLQLITRALKMLERYDQAAQWAQETLQAAAAAGNRSLHAWTLLELCDLRMYQGRLGEAEAYGAAAQAAVAQLQGEWSGKLRIYLFEVQAAQAEARGDFGKQQQFLERAVAEGTTLLGADNEWVARLLHNLSVVVARNGDAERALELDRRALDILERGFSPDHVILAPTLIGLGGRQLALGHLEQAVPYYERAAAILESTDDPALAAAHYNLGVVYDELGRHQDSERECRRALVLREQWFGPDHRALYNPLVCVGVTSVEQEKWKQAVEPLERALALAQPSDADELPSVRAALALALWRLGTERPRATALARQARAEARAIGDGATVKAIDDWLPAGRRR